MSNWVDTAGHNVRTSQKRSDAALMAQVLTALPLVGPLIEASFAETPIVFVNYPGPR